MVFVVEREDNDEWFRIGEEEGDTEPYLERAKEGKVEFGQTITSLEDFVTDEVALSLQSLSGVTSARALKLWGTVAGEGVLVLVDSGALHNFICEKLVQRFGLPISDDRKFTVVIRDGTRREGVGFRKNVGLWLQGIDFRLSCLPFPLAGTDLVLGVPRLETQGKVKADWGYLKMEFSWEGGQALLRGDPSLCVAHVTMKKMVTGYREGDSDYVVEIGPPRSDDILGQNSDSNGQPKSAKWVWSSHQQTRYPQPCKWSFPGF